MARPLPGRAVGVLGAGTGLGVSALVPGRLGWTALPTEGGHVSFAPGNEREDRVLAVLRARLGHVSNERLLSGQGLLNLAQSLAAIDGRTTQAGHGRGGDRVRPQRQLPRLRRGGGDVQRAARGRRRRSGADHRCPRRRLRRRRGLPAPGHPVRPRRVPPAVRSTRAACGTFLEPIPTWLVLRGDTGLTGAAHYRLGD